MKRFFCAWLAALLVLSLGGAALAEAEFDFSGLTLEQLYEVRARLDEAIAAQERLGGAPVYAAGTYVIGRDMPEGDYVLVENADAMFASVEVRSGEGGDSSLVFLKLISGQVVVRLGRDTCMVLSEAQAYPLAAAPTVDPTAGPVPEGAYLVGSQLPAGRYTAAVTERAPLSSYSVYDGILGTDGRLVKFEVLHENTVLELRDGEYIELSGCTLAAEE